MNEDIRDIVTVLGGAVIGQGIEIDRALNRLKAKYIKPEACCNQMSDALDNGIAARGVWVWGMLFGDDGKVPICHCPFCGKELK